MAKKQFKTESKKLLDMMINSIYTHKEIFLRELISNSSDAIDKLYFRSLTDSSVSLNREDYEIRISLDKDARTITLTDNGIGMTKEELENNLGTIAKSGSYEFKNNEENKTAEKDKIDIIGQFGVGFYSAFMVSDSITVKSRAYGSEEANVWQSSGVDGYTIGTCDKDTVGTEIVLHIKPDTDDEKYSDYLESYKIRSLVKKYSDYIRYPIRMLDVHQHLKEGTETEYETHEVDETLNSMIPIWKKPQSEVKKEEYNSFYKEKFFDYEDPLKVIRQKTEGLSNYEALLFIPSHAPYDYYSKEYEKGLQLYSSGVLIMDKCKDLIADYFSFVRGLVDSADLSLNISREMLQHDRQLKSIAKAVEKKISSELTKMLQKDREDYEKFYAAFGTQLKYGIYSDFGAHKDVLKDLVLFLSSNEKKLVTLKEYASRMKEGQEKIYFASGETADQIAMLPQVESVLKHGYEVLYLTEDVDEFALQMMREYDGKTFSNVLEDNPDFMSEEDKEKLKEENEKYTDMLNFMKESIGDGIKTVKFTNTLNDHPACISSEGGISIAMQKAFNRMPGADERNVKADLVLEINMNHDISSKLKALYDNDKDKLAKYSKILCANARLISGLGIENPSELSGLVCELMINQ